MVIDRFWPSVGGAERQALQQAQQLMATGHPVVVVTTRYRLTWPATEVVQGVLVRRVGGVYLGGRIRSGMGLYWIFALNLLVTLLREAGSCDVFHAHQLLRPAAITALAGWLTGHPVIIKCGSTGIAGDVGTLTRRGGWQADYSSLPISRRPSRFVMTRLIGNAMLWLVQHSQARVVATSPAMRRELLDAGFDRARVIPIPNGVNLAHFQPKVRRAAEWHGTKDVVYSGRLSFEKGPDILVGAWRQVARLQPRARLVIAGDGPLRADLETMIKDDALQDRVVFLGQVDDVAPLLQTAYCFVLPSRIEGMPNALLEALACGLPAVATRVSGSEDLIEPGRNGLLVRPEDEDGLAAALVSLLEDEAFASRLAAEARIGVEETYSLEAVSGAYVRLYRSLGSTTA